MPLSLEDLKNKLKNVKLVVSDIDGTLFTSDYKMNSELPELIEKLKEKNILFSIASQRVHSSIVPIARKLNIGIPFISLNGSLIQNLNGDLVLYKGIINEKYLDKSISLSEKYFIKLALSYNDKIIYTEDNSIFKDFFPVPDADYLCVKSYDDFKDGILRIYLSGDNKNKILKIKHKIKPFYNHSLTANFFRSQSHRGLYKVEIYPSGISKKKALSVLSKHLGIKKNEIAVIGDWYNDVELFEFGAINVTLKNGLMDLKRRADYISPYSNEEGGVEDFLKILYNSII